MTIDTSRLIALAGRGIQDCAALAISFGDRQHFLSRADHSSRYRAELAATIEALQATKELCRQRDDLLAAAKMAEDALRDSARHTPGTLCLRNPIRAPNGRCLGASGDGLCGESAGDALVKIITALKSCEAE